MKHTISRPLSSKLDWQEVFSVAFGAVLPKPLNFEWLIDAAERGEWSGLWW